MMEPMKEFTEVRLEKLERELAETKAELCRVRHRNLWLMGGGVLMAGLLALAWMVMDAGRSVLAQGEAKVQQVIGAKSFELVDGQGKIRAALEMTQLGPRLILVNENGKVGVSLTVSGSASSLILSDGKGQRASLTVVGSESELSLTDGKGNSRALLSYGNDRAGLGLFDEKGKLVKSFAIPQ